MSLQLRLRPLRWKNPDGTLDVPVGRTLVIGRWVPMADQMGVNGAPAVLEYRNPISGPTNWTAVEVCGEEP